jgi:hypothetical protein
MISAFGRLKPTFVYMLFCLDDGPIYVKVGLTDQPTKRVQTLMTACPVKPQQFAVCEVRSRGYARRVERGLHKALSGWRTQGEWFKITPDDKPQFQAAWKAVFRQFNSSTWPLTWTEVPTAGLARYWKARRAAFNRNFHIRERRGGAAYKDFLEDSA